MIDAVMIFILYFFGLILIVGVPLSIFEYFDEKVLKNNEQSVREYSRTHRGKFNFSVSDMKEPKKENKQTVIYKSHLLGEVVIEK